MSLAPKPVLYLLLISTSFLQAYAHAKAGKYDGRWMVVSIGGDERCLLKKSTSYVTINNNKISGKYKGHPRSGKVTNDGNFKMSGVRVPDFRAFWNGTISGNNGSGSFVSGRCTGKFTLTKK